MQPSYDPEWDHAISHLMAWLKTINRQAHTSQFGKALIVNHKFPRRKRYRGLMALHRRKQELI